MKQNTDYSSHFNTLAANYDEEIPRHIRKHLCIKKTNLILRELKKHFGNDPTKLQGLDCGCGTGWHIKRLRSINLAVAGIDPSNEMISRAKKNNNFKAPLYSGSATDLPFADESYDFVYFINVLHHLPSRQAQASALQEAKRVLKQNGLLLVFEMNPDPLLFRIYIDYIFPLTSNIDNDQQELWFAASKLSHLPGLKTLDTTYFTFLPNITPLWGFKTFVRLEQLLEKLTHHKTGAHYCASLEKTGA